MSTLALSTTAALWALVALFLALEARRQTRLAAAELDSMTDKLDPENVSEEMPR